MLITMGTGAAVRGSIKGLDVAGKITSALKKFPSLADAIQLASKAYRFFGQASVKVALSAAVFGTSVVLAEQFGGFFKDMLAFGLGVAGLVFVSRMSFDFMGISPGDVLGSARISAARGLTKARAWLTSSEVSAFENAGFSNSVREATLRAVDLGLLDREVLDPSFGVKPGLLGKMAEYLSKPRPKIGNDFDEILSDWSLYRTRTGAAGAHGLLRSYLGGGAFDNVDALLLEVRAVVRGSGHSFDDVTGVQRFFDANGNPVADCHPCFAEIDGTLVNLDLIEVKSTKYWSGKDGLRQYLTGTRSNQLLRQRQLLQTLGGNEILLYIDGKWISKAQEVLDDAGITNVQLFAIPGTEI